jgi:diguanylate cyclase (GGDEF)-like protein
MENLAQEPKQDTQIADKVHTDRLRLLFRQSLLATFGSFMAACMLGWLHWDRGDHHVISTWLTLLGCSSLVRLVMFMVYFRAPVNQRTPQRWERVYWITLVTTGGIWGIGALVLMVKDDLLSQAITLLFAVGMAGSAVSTYSAYRSMTLVAIGLVLLPSTVWLLLQPLPMQRALALSTLLFSVFVIRATRELSNALQTSFRLTHEMAQAHRIASHAAHTDVLTGINNRRAFFERADQLLTYCQRHQHPLCVLVMDLDHFKSINDTYGHHAGDMVLRQVGALLQSSFRAADLCGRLGGEEFAMVLADTPIKAGLDMAEQLRSDVSQLSVELPQGQLLRVTVSLGVVAVGRQSRDDFPTLLQRADEAMYRAKAAGRNRVVATSESQD